MSADLRINVASPTDLTADAPGAAGNALEPPSQESQALFESIYGGRRPDASAAFDRPIGVAPANQDNRSHGEADFGGPQTDGSAVFERKTVSTPPDEAARTPLAAPMGERTSVLVPLKSPMGERTSIPEPLTSPTGERTSVPETLTSPIQGDKNALETAGGGGRWPAGASQEQETPSLADLSSLLSSALDGRGGSPPGDVQPTAAEPAGPSDRSGFELAEKLVSRILVSEPSASGQEVRLTVDSSLLPGAEIRLSRGTDGFLNVTLLASEPGSFQVLVQARQDLERALERSEGAAFQLTLSNGEDDRQPDRRSRGLDYLDQG
jgi:type III secretion system needle length determinant